MMIMIDIITRIIRFQSILRGSLRTPFDWSDLGIFCYSISLFACQSAGIVAVKTYQKLPSWYQKGSGFSGDWFSRLYHFLAPPVRFPVLERFRQLFLCGCLSNAQKFYLHGCSTIFGRMAIGYR